MRRYLIVANQTLVSEELLAKARASIDSGPCTFYIVVPATHTKSGLTWTEGEARSLAGARLEDALARFERLGAEVGGEVGDEDPLLAISDVLLSQPFDELILSTLPPGRSRWIKHDVPHRVERAFSSALSVTLLTSMAIGANAAP